LHHHNWIALFGSLERRTELIYIPFLICLKSNPARIGARKVSAFARKTRRVLSTALHNKTSEINCRSRDRQGAVWFSLICSSSPDGSGFELRPQLLKGCTNFRRKSLFLGLIGCFNFFNGDKCLLSNPRVLIFRCVFQSRKCWFSQDSKVRYGIH